VDTTGRVTGVKDDADSKNNKSILIDVSSIDDTNGSRCDCCRTRRRDRFVILVVAVVVIVMVEDFICVIG
jgi:hypothetical protein